MEKDMTKGIDIGKRLDAHQNLLRTDRMVRECNPEIIDVFCQLNMFLNENKEFQKTREYENIAKDVHRARNEFIDKCMIKK